jgi:hypothetical protein
MHADFDFNKVEPCLEPPVFPNELPTLVSIDDTDIGFIDKLAKVEGGFGASTSCTIDLGSERVSLLFGFKSFLFHIFSHPDKYFLEFTFAGRPVGVNRGCL